MFQMQGTVQAVSNQQKFYQTKQGTCYNASFKMEDNQWYVIPFVNQGMPHPVQQGQQVSFQYEQQQNGQYTNNKVNPKSIQVQGGQPQQAQPPQQQQQQPQPQPGQTQQQAHRQDDRQNQIMRQNALAHATAVVCNDAESANNGLDDVCRKIIHLADEYFFQYAKTGKVPVVTQPQVQPGPPAGGFPQDIPPPPQQPNPSPQGQQAPDSFDDDIPF